MPQFPCLSAFYTAQPIDRINLSQWSGTLFLWPTTMFSQYLSRLTRKTVRWNTSYERPGRMAVKWLSSVICGGDWSSAGSWKSEMVLGLFFCLNVLVATAQQSHGNRPWRKKYGHLLVSIDFGPEGLIRMGPLRKLFGCCCYKVSRVTD